MNYHPFFSDSPEQTLAANLPHSKRNQMGQVFTPYAIARVMANWVTAHRPPTAILDPALGMGIFLRAILETSPALAPLMTGYEVDTDMADSAQRLFNDNGCRELKIHTASFLTSGWNPRYDAILCNPPYRRFRGLPGKDLLVEQVRENTGIEISRAANLYVFFLVKLVHQLAEGGRGAVIVPYEFLNADYGQVVKQYLIDQNVLRKVLVLGENIKPFERVITTTCILCLERAPTENPPEVQICSTMDELTNALNPGATDSTPKTPPLPFPMANRKWLAPAIDKPIESRFNLVPLSTFGRITRGIATGDNGYFLLNEEQRQKWDLGETCILPCLSKSSLAPDHLFSTTSFEQLKRKNKPVWLFQARGQEHDPAVEIYLIHGIERGTDRRYLTRMRTPWYMLEERPPAPLLATTFSRHGIRWVRNEAGVRFLTTFHGFYPFAETDLDLLAAYLITPLAQRILAQNRREYGNGLHKFEPNDLNQGLVVDISNIPENTQVEVKEIYNELISCGSDTKETSAYSSELDRVFRKVAD